jgi:ubiquinone/menaquinone biosynthesis C-methylase UbiE
MFFVHLHNTPDLVISNCVINLTTDKVSTFKEVYRILKNQGGRMMISDLVTDREVDRNSVNIALTKENYLQSIKSAGFKNVEVLEEKTYIEEEQGENNNNKDTRRKISSLIIKAVYEGKYVMSHFHA